MGKILDLKKFFGAWDMSDCEEKAMKKDLKKIWAGFRFPKW